MGSMASVYCGSCGARNAAAVRFCTSCGQDQAQFVQPGESVGLSHPDASAGTEPVPPARGVVSPPDGHVIAPPDVPPGDRVGPQHGPFMRWFLGEDDPDFGGAGGSPQGNRFMRWFMGEDIGEQSADRGAIPSTGGLANQKEQNVTGVVVAGYICAVVLPLVGAIIGATQLNRNRHGAWILGLSIAMALLSIIIGVVLFSIVANSVSELESYGSEYEY